MFYLENLEGDFFPFVSDYALEEDTLGNTVLSADIQASETNNEFLKYLSTLWRLTDRNDDFTIVLVDSQNKGKSLTKRIKAIPTWVDKLESTRENVLYEPKSYSLDTLLFIIFYGTGYTYVIEDSFGSIWIEGFGNGDTRLSMLKRVLKRYDAEIEFSQGTCTFKKRIGKEKDVFLHHRVNLSNLSKSVDCQNFYTVATGFGDYKEGAAEESGKGEDWQHHNLKETYVSPLVKLLGEREAPPIKDGRITSVDTMQRALKELVDNSIVITIEANILNLKFKTSVLENRDPIIEIGDVVKLNDDVARIYNQIRAIKKTTKYDHKGNVLNIDYVFSTSDDKNL